MRFCLLGPIDVIGPAGPVALPGVKPRALLAALLLEHGRTVPAERLIRVVWGEEPPTTARAVVQTYVATLRRALDAAGVSPVITSDRHGYRAEIEEDALDVRVFERHVERGRQAARGGDHAGAAETFRTGLALWRGPALGGIGESFLRAEATRLDELRLTVTEERVDADLAVGQGPQLLAELTELVALHPTRERLRGGLMVALYRAGRQTDALEVYERGRLALHDELGIDPGPELRALHQSILRCDPALLPTVTSRTPRQLPSPPPDFTGRVPEMGDYPETHAALTEARALFVAAGSRRGEGLTLRSLSLYHRARGEWAQAEQLARAAIAAFDPTQDRMLVAYSERALAKALLRLGDTVTARRLAENALAVCRSLDDDFGQACGLGVVGEVHLADGRLHQARACLEDALRQWTEMRAELFRACTLRTLAEVRDALGDAEAARAMTAEAMETFRTHGAREYQELRPSRSVAGRD